MHICKFTTFLIGCTALCALAAEPLPEIKIDATDGGSIVHIKNVGSQALTAYLIELVDYPGSHFSDFVDLAASEPIAAGSEKSYPVKNMTIGASPEYVKATAAIYADGSTSGMPGKVAEIVERRKTTLKILRELTTRFEKAQSSGASKEALSAELKQWAESETPRQKKQINAANASPAAAPVTILMARKHLEEHSIAESLQYLRHSQQALAASKPALE